MITVILLLAVVMLSMCCFLTNHKIKKEVRKELTAFKEETKEVIRRLR